MPRAVDFLKDSWISSGCFGGFNEWKGDALGIYGMGDAD